MRGRRPWIVFIAGAIAGGLVVAGFAFFVLPWLTRSGDAQPASVEEALRDFRGGEPRVTTDARLRPPEGVYVYDAEGREESGFSTGPEARAIGPEAVAIVRHDTRCADGWTFELRVSSKHVDRLELCAGPGELLLAGYELQNEIGGTTATNRSTCPEPLPLQVRGAEAGRSEELVCNLRTNVIGREFESEQAMTVTPLGSGEALGTATWSVRVEDVVDESVASSRFVDTYTIAQTTGMLVRIERQHETSALGGAARATQTATFTLRSLDPRR